MTTAETQETMANRHEAITIPEGAFISDAGRISAKVKEIGSCVVNGVPTEQHAHILAQDIMTIAPAYHLTPQLMDFSTGVVTQSNLETVDAFAVERRAAGLLIINGLSRVIDPAESVAGNAKVLAQDIAQIINDKNGPAVCGINIGTPPQANQRITRILSGQTSVWSQFKVNHDFGAFIQPCDAIIILREFFSKEKANAEVEALFLTQTLTYPSIQKLIQRETAKTKTS